MLKRLGLAAAMVVVGVATATAADRPLFEFRGEVPVPGGTARLETRCDKETDGLQCRAGGRGPSGEGFQFEVRLRSLLRDHPSPENTEKTRNAPQWF
jgi:hypothetical protein